MGNVSAAQPKSSSPGSRPGHAAGDLLDGRYRLVTRLGHGGFGDVWRAEELLPDGAPFREVALKLLVPGVGDAVDWAEEAKLLASFRHPSLVTIYAAGILTMDGSPLPSGRAASLRPDARGGALAGAQRFVAMELLLGDDLADVGRARGTIPWRKVLRWASSAAGALDLIHAAGVVHLDLKPANLFLCADGALKVLDFGIARRAGVMAVVAQRGAHLARDATTSDAERATGLFIAARGPETPRSSGEDAFAATRPMESQPGGREVVIGTPGFMAPEILELAQPTAAADAYALAVCVVLLCTGHLPHMAPDEPEAWDDPTAVSAWLDAIRRATLRGTMRPLAGTGDIPAGLAALLRRLLEVDPKDRGVTPGGLRALFDEAWERPHGVPDPPYFPRRAYPPEAEGILFGRDDDVARLGRELEYEPCVVLQGAVGSGKSSLLVAGLVPYLGRHGVDGKDDWRAAVIAMDTGDARDARDTPDARLSAALGAVLPELADADYDTLAAHCAAAHVGIALVVDPIEGVLGASEAGAARLSTLLARAARGTSGAATPGLRVLGAIGEDATPALRASALGASLRGALRFVGAPATAAVTDIVAGPAHHAGVTVLAAELVASDVRRELRAGGSRLPFVALALEEWWRRRGPALQGEQWKETGGVGGAVVRHADRVFARLTGEPRRLSEELLLRLAATDGSKLRWDEAELLGALAGGDGAPGDAAGRLALARRVTGELARELLVRVGSDGAERWVEIGHEALLKEWTFLASARLANMDRLLVLERLREARVAWERADGHRDFLLQGRLFDDIAARVAALVPWLGPADRGFLEASRRRARVRRLGRFAAAAFVGLALVGGAASKRMIDDARDEEARVRAAAIELEALGEMAARARRTDDPYHRAALSAAALARGSTDGVLPLELAVTANNLARADFLTLEHVDAPAFPWDDRFLLGTTGAGALAVFDFRPPGPDVIEDVELDADPEAEGRAHFRRPTLTHLRAHEGPIVERVDFVFDTAFATRAASGEVKVFRIRDDGVPALAAVAPVRCLGPMRVAGAVPVLACGAEHGVARWDLRRGVDASAVTTRPLPGDVADVSDDGERVAVLADREVVFWSSGGAPDLRYAAPRPVGLVRFGPQGAAAALLEGPEVEIVSAGSGKPSDDRSAAQALFVFEPDTTHAVQLRWDTGGVDLAVCEPSGGRWYYLRRGGRAAADARPTGDPCAPQSGARAARVPALHAAPETIPLRDGAPELADLELGAHLPAGGWRLRGRRLLTRDLVVLDPSYGADPLAPPGAARAAASRLLRFEPRDDIGSEEPREPGDSVAAVERDDAEVMFQVGDEMRFYGLPDGNRMAVRKGNFLRRCADGRFLAWDADGPTYRVFDAWSGALVRGLPRDPGFVVGIGPACSALVTQRLDGTLVAHPLDGRPARELGRADGYVYEARASGARRDAEGGTGLLLAFSSGAIARVDEGDPHVAARVAPGAEGAPLTVRVLGYATPRAQAIADGPRTGDVVLTEGARVSLLRPGAPPVLLHEGDGLVEWSDVASSPDGSTLLLVGEGRVAALDVVRRELTGSVPILGKDRIAAWDDEGSVLLWSFDRRGPPDGSVVPRGASLARHVAAAVSNLEVEHGRVVVRR